MDTNPYAAPAPLPRIDDAHEARREALFATRGAWRDGRLLVMTRESTLPPWCVKSDEPAAHFETVRVQWTPSWIYGTLLLGPFFLLFVELYGQRIRLKLPLGRSWFRKQNRRLFVSVGLIGAGYLIGAGLALSGLLDQLPVWLRDLAIACIAVILLNGLLGLVFWNQGPLHIRRADERFLWLGGATDAFLSRLPDWPLGNQQD